MVLLQMINVFGRVDVNWVEWVKFRVEIWVLYDYLVAVRGLN